MTTILRLTRSHDAVGLAEARIAKAEAHNLPAYPPKAEFSVASRRPDRPGSGLYSHLSHSANLLLRDLDSLFGCLCQLEEDPHRLCFWPTVRIQSGVHGTCLTFHHANAFAFGCQRRLAWVSWKQIRCTAHITGAYGAPTYLLGFLWPGYQTRLVFGRFAA